MKVNIYAVTAFLAIVSFICLACGGGEGGGTDGEKGNIGKPAQFSIATIDGGILTPGDFRGKVVLVDYWAIWCAPCRKEFPDFEKLLDTYGDDIAIIAISCDEDKKVLDKFLEENPLPFIIGILDGTSTLSWDEPKDIPVAYVIDRDGIIRASFKGGHKFEHFDKEIKPLIEKSVEEEQPEEPEEPSESAGAE
jgi:thiol-disulfide isomerase/thioredoxin